MSLRSTILILSFITSTFCLGVGYIAAGEWLVIPILVLAYMIWFALKNRSVFWSATTMFLFYILIAGFGISTNISVPLMVTGGFSALLTWDLIIFNRSGIGLDASSNGNLLEKNHLKSLSLATLAGILATVGASFLNFQLSFAVMVILGLLATGCLILGVQTLQKNGK